MRVLLTPSEIDRYRDHIVAMLLPVVRDCARGEFEIDDILTLAKEGHVYLAVSDSIVGAFEFRHYPQRMSVNIVAIGGTGLQEAADRYFTAFREWAAKAGAEEIEASCSKAMARLLRRHGFENTYEVVRIKTEVEHAHPQ